VRGKEFMDKDKIAAFIKKQKRKPNYD